MIMRILSDQESILHELGKREYMKNMKTYIFFCKIMKKDVS